MSNLGKTTILIALIALSASRSAVAAEPAPAATPAPAPSPAPSATPGALGAEQLNVDSIKEKYWARGDESELGVVQNRMYSKEHKIEVGVFAGIVATDPFLSVQNFGLSVGYHISEYFSVHVVGWKDYPSLSSAEQTFEQQLGAQAPTNMPYGFLGGELEASILYGKLSLVGKKIIHFDLHLTGGMGNTWTETGSDFTPYVGIGQQVYLSKWSTLRIDYRLMEYNEQLLDKSGAPTTTGKPMPGTRTNWTNAITLGVTFFAGGWGGDSQ